MGFNYKTYTPAKMDLDNLVVDHNENFEVQDKIEVSKETYDLSLEKKPNPVTSFVSSFTSSFNNTINNKGLKKVSKRKSQNTEAVIGLDYSIIEKMGFKVQGFSSNNGYSFISAYDKNHKDNSAIFVFDKNGNYVCKIKTSDKAHLGGISIDESNDIMFTTGTGTEGKVYAYDFSGMTFEKGKDLDIEDYKLEVKLDEETETIIHNKGRSSTLYAADGKLYICNFDGTKKTKLCEVDYDYYKSTSVNETGRLELKIIDEDKQSSKYQKYYNGASATQGVATYNGKNGKQYFVFSSSYGVLNSRLTVYVRDGNKLYKVSTNYTNIRGLEGVYIDKNGDISAVSEAEDPVTYKLGNVEKIIDDPNTGKWTTRNRVIKDKMFDYFARHYAQKSHKK